MTCAYSKCGREFEPRRTGQKYHSPTCKEKARNERHPVVRLTSPKEAVRACVTTAGRHTRERSVGGQGLTMGIFREAGEWLRIQGMVNGFRC